MRRVRIAFALLALALAAAGALLVNGALESVRSEREMQERTLAARVFDEMERSLSTFLSREEATPFPAWLAPRPDDPPFVRARFTLSPDGAVALGAGAPPELGPVLAAWSRNRRATPKRAEARALDAVRDGARLALGASEAKKDAQETLYDALQSLNRGAEERAQRARKLETEAPTIGKSQGRRYEERDLPDQDAAAVAPAAAPPAAGALAQAPAAPLPEAQPATEIAAVDPLFGDRLDGGDLLLVRTVLFGGRGYRQGLVLDGNALGAWLRAQVLEGRELPGLDLQVETADAAVSAGPFAHRFAEPFDAVAAILTLPPLPGDGGAGTVLRLSALLVAVAGLALLALYRMVAVALRFAERRSNFVAAVSHELKTPLTSIRMYGEMLRDGLAPTEEKRVEYARTITAESERLSRLIDNVLEFARTERGERRAALRSGPLADEVAAVVEMLRPHARGDGFTLALEAEADLPPVRHDRDALSQILVNLVDNALKYARAATDRVVHIRLAASGGGVAISVRDHGPGVPAAQLDRVFELFHRGEDELTRTTRGTGLGLALVRSLAERMGARVSARNAAGGGFEVEILFPSAS